MDEPKEKDPRDLDRVIEKPEEVLEAFLQASDDAEEILILEVEDE